MSDKTLQESLLALAKSDNRRKKARIRENLDAIETAISAGVAYSSIIAVMADHGLKMSVQSFATTLARVRQERAISAAATHWTTDPDDAEQAKQPTPKTTGHSATTTETKIATPRDIRELRRRSIDLESLINSETKS